MKLVRQEIQDTCLRSQQTGVADIQSAKQTRTDFLTTRQDTEIIDREPPLVIIDPQLLTPHQEGVIVTASAREAIDTVPHALGFLLLGLNTQDLQAAAIAIRRSTHGLLPIFTDTEGTNHPLLDGTKDLAAARVAGQRMYGLLRSLQLNLNALQFDERLLVYLYMRDRSELVPLLDRQAKSLYRYPVVDALAESPKLADETLEDLLKRRLLLPRTLIDRTRHCVRCGSAHLHFIDVCPHCASIDIRKAPALHCFVCGHVGPQSDFQVQNGLVCPQCHTQLRHIGVDYDRPLTQYVCGDCRHAFIEPDIVARCLDCGTKNAPEALPSHDVTTLVLSAQGRTALRSGRLDESFASLDVSNFVIPNYFRHMVDWALLAQRRHPDLEFSLVLMDIRNADALVQTLGHQRAYALFDELIRRLSEFLRDSDLVTRSLENRLWIFLPMSSAHGFIQRAQAMLSELAVPDGPELQVKLGALTAPQGVLPGETANDIMQRLGQTEGQGHVG